MNMSKWVLIYYKVNTHQWKESTFLKSKYHLFVQWLNPVAFYLVKYCDGGGSDNWVRQGGGGTEGPKVSDMIFERSP